MTEDWIKIYETPLQHKVEIVKQVLEGQSIKTFIINKKDSMHIHLTNGEIELYVEQENVLRAKHIISKHEL